MVHVETNAGRGEDESVVDDQLFEERKNAKRKQFKAGTRKSFFKAYNLYEDLFSKHSYTTGPKRDATSSKQSVKSAKGAPRKIRENFLAHKVSEAGIRWTPRENYNYQVELCDSHKAKNARATAKGADRN